MCDKCNDSGRVPCPELNPLGHCATGWKNQIHCPPDADQDHCTVPCDCKDGGGEKLSVDEIERAILENAEPPIEILSDGAVHKKPDRAVLEADLDAMRPVVEAVVASDPKSYCIYGGIISAKCDTYHTDTDGENPTPCTRKPLCIAVEKYLASKEKP